MGFTSLVNCYGSVPDIDSCLDMVEAMQSKDEWPSPTVYAYSACLKALTLYFQKPMDYEKGWAYIERIRTAMRVSGLKSHESTYGLLFTLCGGTFCGQSDLQKLYEFYDEMLSE